jgi:hypothetical protein
MTAAETAPKPFPDLYSCNGPQFKQLAEAALLWLETNKELVNALNVFPIPDGDTGTNMSLTMQAAMREVSSVTDRSAGRVAHALAHGALMGARGNSGVILSQIWRGFARAIDGNETIDAPLFASALREASTTAYRASVRPVEGTILTVIKDAALAAEDAATRHRELRTLLERIVSAAHTSVERTPELLPVLKQAGVVDSGGKGLTIILEGMLRYMRGLPLDVAVETGYRPLKLDAVGAAMETIEPGQEWEVIVDFKPRSAVDLPSMYGRLENMGTAIQVGEGDGMFRVHIHLLKSRRYEPLDLAEDLGDESAAVRARAALATAGQVVAITPFLTEELRSVAKVLLPMGTFAETSGTYVNLEGTWQSVPGAARPVGEARPGWKILRVLGNLTGLDGFDYQSTEDVINELKAKCGSADYAEPGSSTRPVELQGSTVAVVDVPIYRVDALVRRAPALQATRAGQPPARAL